MTKSETLLYAIEKTEHTLKQYQQYYKFLLEELAKLDEDAYHEYLMNKEMRFKSWNMGILNHLKIKS